jgi:2-octaprenyl-6-methoxyphenol hydroxylase
LALDDAALLAEIQKYFGYRVGKLLNIEDRYSYPIQEIIAKEQTKPGLLLLGNAAHNLSPVAAQGFNLALQDIYVLANLCCAENLQAETVIGCYLAAREKSQKNVIRFTDSLMRWFNPDNPLNIFASFGLAICDGIPPLKRRVAELGMGLTAPVKELLKKNS